MVWKSTVTPLLTARNRSFSNLRHRGYSIKPAASRYNLGAAAGGGLPQWNFSCFNCNLARSGLDCLKPQTQSPIAVSVDGAHWGVINASPDIRSQVQKAFALSPSSNSVRHSPIASVLITNGDVDHIAGRLSLRERQPFALFATSTVHAIVEENPVFRVLDPALVPRIVVSTEMSFPFLEGLDVKLFSVPGKTPVFLEGEHVETNVVSEQTVGVEIQLGSARFYYIPGCASIPGSLAKRISGAEAVLFDGTVYTDDEMLATGTGVKTGRRMGHMPISGPDGSLGALHGLDIGRTIYLHINNTNPIWRAGAERDALSSRGFEVAYDGMEIGINARS